MQSAKTVHFDGTGSFALKGDFSMSFDMKLTGDIELPDRSRTTMQTSLVGQNLVVKTITVGGKAYASDPKTGLWTEAAAKSGASLTSVLPTDPLGSLDLSGIAGVVEVDRAEVAGRKTRHLHYTADPTKLLGAMQKAAGSSPLPFSNPTGSGDLWIRVDDGQIVRQAVKISLDIGDLSSLIPSGQIPGATPGGGKSTFEMGFDMRFSHHGEPVPEITAPPVSSR